MQPKLSRAALDRIIVPHSEKTRISTRIWNFHFEQNEKENGDRPTLTQRVNQRVRACLCFQLL